MCVYNLPDFFITFLFTLIECVDYLHLSSTSLYLDSSLRHIMLGCLTHLIISSFLITLYQNYLYLITTVNIYQ